MPDDRTARLSASDLQSILDRSEVVVGSAAIDSAISRLATTLNHRFAGEIPVLMCIMRGGLMLTGRLMAELRLFSQIDFLQTSRYGDKIRGGDLEWWIEPAMSLKDRLVILVDDVYDEGQTLAGIHDYCLAAGAGTVFSLVLIEKLHENKIQGYRPDLIGLEVENRFLFGFGMDYAGYFRHLPDVYALHLEEDAGTALQ